jgi:hypothetical protein
MKTESVAEFLARGGNINKVAINKSAKKSNGKEPKASLEDINMKDLPKALRIKYGIKV